MRPDAGRASVIVIGRTTAAWAQIASTTGKGLLSCLVHLQLLLSSFLTPYSSITFSVILSGSLVPGPSASTPGRRSTRL